MSTATQTKTDFPQTLRQQTVLYGAMNICGNWRNRRSPEEAAETLLAAYQAGYRVFDHANIYGGGKCEAAHGQALAQNPSMAKDSFTISKAGHVFPKDGGKTPHHYNTSRQHLVDQAKASRDRLGVEAIDLFLVHRYDPLGSCQEIAAALQELAEGGIARSFGVSNFLPHQFDALQAHCPFPLIANQIKFNPYHYQPIYDGSLDHCQQHGIVPLAWSPYEKGFLSGKELPEEADARLGETLHAVQLLAEQLGRATLEVTTAWIRRHPAAPIPVNGSTHPGRMAAALASADLPMDDLAWYRILIAAQQEKLP